MKALAGFYFAVLGSAMLTSLATDLWFKVPPAAWLVALSIQIALGGMLIASKWHEDHS